jgi:hypothetical protein
VKGKKFGFGAKKLSVPLLRTSTETKNLFVSGKIIDTETKRSDTIKNFLKELKI